MSRNNVIVGIDTSNYTTSAAVVDEDGKMLLNHKLPLKVREGERGLRQSDAVFAHVKNLSQTAKALGSFIRENGLSVKAVGCSSKPRNAERSYMPCFLAGESAAEFMSESLGVTLYRTSHQTGHVMAAAYSAYGNDTARLEELTQPNNEFIAFHVSGGTTDVLLCRGDEEEVLKIEQIGGSRDINGGQAVDRAGVMMGLAFPCGAEMDAMALGYTGKVEKSRLSVDGLWCNLSGLENKSAGLYEKTKDPAAVSAYVLDFLARTLEKITENALAEYKIPTVIYAGGVMSSLYVKKYLGKYGLFAEGQYSSDNAAGVALTALEMHKRNKKVIVNE